MSNIKVKSKNVRRDDLSTPDGWVLMAEDAEREAAKARERSDQLLKAARMFKDNAENGGAVSAAACKTELSQYRDSECVVVHPSVTPR
jgi:hypothetical protein